MPQYICEFGKLHGASRTFEGIHGQLWNVVAYLCARRVSHCTSTPCLLLEVYVTLYAHQFALFKTVPFACNVPILQLLSYPLLCSPVHRIYWIFTDPSFAALLRGWPCITLTSLGLPGPGCRLCILATRPPSWT